MSKPGAEQSGMYSAAQQFRSGFRDGFGFSGLFNAFEQEPLPEADVEYAALDALDKSVVRVIAHWDEYSSVKRSRRLSDALNVVQQELEIILRAAE